jgi:hypothetical protein
VHLCDLHEASVSVGHGMFGKYGDLGYNEGASRKILVNGTAALHGISLHPPPNTDGKVGAPVLLHLSRLRLCVTKNGLVDGRSCSCVCA